MLGVAAPLPVATRRPPLPRPNLVLGSPPSVGGRYPNLDLRAMNCALVRFGTVAAAFATALLAAAPASAEKISNPVAVFAGLDKITGRIISFDVYIDETVQFGALQVTPRVCYSRPPTEPPLTDAFIEVDEITLNRTVKRIFTGWMFAASPGLHAVDHAVYDVWLTDCKTTSPVAPPGNR
jgi:hypothetical protein